MNIILSSCNAHFIKVKNAKSIELQLHNMIGNRSITLVSYFSMVLKFGDVTFSMCNGDAICLN